MNSHRLMTCDVMTASISWYRGDKNCRGRKSVSNHSAVKKFSHCLIGAVCVDSLSPCSYLSVFFFILVNLCTCRKCRTLLIRFPYSSLTDLRRAASSLVLPCHTILTTTHAHTPHCSPTQCSSLGGHSGREGGISCLTFHSQLCEPLQLPP